MLEGRVEQWLERERRIRTCVFPSAVLTQFRANHPELELKDAQLTARALRQFFLVYLRAGGRLVCMPSKAADALWHSFILDTKAYTVFCNAAFGAYLHHIPERTMAARSDDAEAVWRTWQLACLEENINPARATRLPLLYALDSKLRMPGAVTHNPSDFKPPPGSGSCGGGGGSNDDGGDGGGCGGGE